MKTVSLMLGILAIYAGMDMLDMQDVLDIWQPAALLGCGCALLWLATR